LRAARRGNPPPCGTTVCDINSYCHETPTVFNVCYGVIWTGTVHMNASILRYLGAVAIIVVISARPVDAAAPVGHYVVTAGSGPGNGTVYDTKSKLTWQQTVSSTTYAWADAKTYCAGVGTSLGGTGWRLPTIKELQSIVDLSQATGPYIDPNAFPSTPSNWFWSSTPLAGSPSDAWLVAFNLGDTSNYAVSFVYNVCCVR